MATTMTERVAAEAMSVRPGRLLLTVLAFPFYVLGWLLGLLVVCFLFAVSAVKVGISDARARGPRGVTDGSG